MRYLKLICFPLLHFGACSLPVNQEKLIGSWDYTRIENLNPNTEDSTTVEDLKLSKPYIQFSANDRVKIVWDGKILSSGTYRLDGKMIRYKENLPDGQVREFPFLVSKLSENEIVFETMTRQGTRVTAIKRE